MGDHGPDFQKTIADTRSGDQYKRQDAVYQLVQFGREAEVPLVSLLAETPDRQEHFSIFLALREIRVTYASSVDTLVGLLNLASHRRVAAKLLLHSSPNIRRHLPVIRAILERETDDSTRNVLQKLLDRYPNFGKPQGPLTN